MTRAAGGLLACTAAATVLLSAATAPRADALSLGVTTLSPEELTSSSAVLRATASISVLGTSVRFDYGPTTTYGSVAKDSVSSLLTGTQSIRVQVAGLTPNTTYHVRAVAVALLSTTYGRDITFTTPAPGASPAPAPPSGTPGDAPVDPGANPPTDAPTVPGTPGDSGKPGDSRKPGAPTSGGTPTDAPLSDAPGAGVPDGSGPRPELGRTVGVEAVAGTVTIQTPDGDPTTLARAAALPTGTVVDTRRGTVALTSALDRRGTTQTGRFWGGVFEVRQSRTGRGVTQLVLRGGDFTDCPSGAPGTATAAAARPPRALWGSDKHGRFQTRGRGSVATVRGTRWVTEDWCQGTLTRVTEGAVVVRDLHLRHTVVVRRGERYFARAAGPT